MSGQFTKIPLKMMSLIESDVKIDLLNILHVDDKNIFQKQAINILVDRSPEVIELLLIKIMNILIEIQHIHGEEELMRLQTNLSLMLMILKNMHKLHPNLILPPFFEPIYRKMQKEPEISFDKGSSWIRNFIDKNKLIAKNYNYILLQHTLNKESSDTLLKDVPQTLSSYVKAIPMFLLKQVGGL